MEIERKRLYASESESLLRLSVACEILMKDTKALMPRASLFPGGRRDIAMIAAKIKTLMGGFMETIPDNQLQTFQRTLQMSDFVIGAKRPGGQRSNNTDYGMWVSYNHLNEIMRGLHDHCMMCNLDKGQRRACPLRKALDGIPNDSEDRDDGDCQYYTVV